MSRSKTKDGRLIEQLARGRRFRYVQRVPFIAALDRTTINGASHILADAIDGDTITKGIFALPCAGKITRIYANAKTWLTKAAGGTCNATVYKANIGAADTALCTAFSVGSDAPPTDETYVEATLSTTAGALNIIDGQLIYVSVASSAEATTARTDSLVFNVEWIPMDGSYASDT